MDENKDEYIAALHDEIKRMECRLKSTVTLRDQFAIAALSSLMLHENNVGWANWGRKSYEIADMLLEARAALGEKKDE